MKKTSRTTTIAIGLFLIAAISTTISAMFHLDAKNTTYVKYDIQDARVVEYEYGWIRKLLKGTQEKSGTIEVIFDNNKLRVDAFDIVIADSSYVEVKMYKENDMSSIVYMTKDDYMALFDSKSTDSQTEK